LKNIIFFLITSFCFISPDVTANENQLCIEGSEDCSFALLNDKSGQLITVNQKRANEPMSPFSTFKIANSLIGLDTQVISNNKQTLTYDKTIYKQEPWWPPVWKLASYNLASAYKFSMVPVYRQLASDIGKTAMKKYLQKFNYGNQDISSGLDDFWLNGSLKISAIEQVQFLQKLHRQSLGLSFETYKNMKLVMLAKSSDDYKIYAKTGAGKVDDGSMLGWYVGYLESAKGIHYFAMNFNRKTYSEMKKDRINMVMNHLKQAGIIHK
jgi:beta-lactamase class D